MHLYLFLLCNFILSCYGASSSTHPAIVLIHNPAPNGLYFYESHQQNNGLYITNFVSNSNVKDPFNIDNSNGNGFHVTNNIISKQALQNDRQQFPAKFTIRYRLPDGTWYCGDHYVMPDQFWYRDPDHDQLSRLHEGHDSYKYREINKTLLEIPSTWKLPGPPLENDQPTRIISSPGITRFLDRMPRDAQTALEQNIKINEAIHNAPLKKFPEDNYQPTRTALPQDIVIYLELNKFDGPLLPDVGRYFNLFPGLCILSLKRAIRIEYWYSQFYSHEKFNTDVLAPGITFLRIQEHKDPAERFNIPAESFKTPAPYERYLNSQAQLFNINVSWDTMPKLPLGIIPPWPAQCIRSKESLTLRACLNPTQPTELRGRIIDLRNHTIDINELKNVTGEGNIFVLSAGEKEGIPFNPPEYNYYANLSTYGFLSGKAQLSNEQVTEINSHFARQCPWYRRCLDTLYKYRYYFAAGAAATVTAAYIYNNHHDLVLKHAREIAPIVEKLALQRNLYRSLKNLIATAKDKQTVAQMTADEMRSLLNAQIDIATVRKELYHLYNVMPHSWNLLHSLVAAIKNSLGKITGIIFGTYVAEVYAKYFLGYRPYQPSRIHVQNDFHDYHHDKIPYKEVGTEPADSGRYTERGHCCHACDIATFYEHKPRNFDALLLHYDEATEARFKRNQSLATLGACVGIPFAAILWYATQHAKRLS